MLRRGASTFFNLYWAGTTSDWSETTNWSPNQLPGLNDNIFLSPSVPFSASPVIVNNFEVHALSISSGTVTIENGSLILSGGSESSSPETYYEGFTKLWVEGFTQGM